MNSVPGGSPLPSKSPAVDSEFLGKGAHGSVNVLIGPAGQKWAVKVGVMGPLEAAINRVAKDHFVSFEPLSGMQGRLVTVLCPGKLEKTPAEAVPVAIHVIETLMQHSSDFGKPLVHLDIKPQNIVLTSSGTPKLIDWGIAVTAGTPHEFITTSEGEKKLNTKGTPGYIPPEAYGDPLDDEALPEPYSEKYDSWSLGITMYELLSGGLSPFANAPDRSIATAMLAISPKSKKTFLDTLDNLPKAAGVPDVAYTVMKGLLAIDSNERLSPKEALSMLKGSATETSNTSPTHVSDSLPPSLSPLDQPPIAATRKSKSKKLKKPDISHNESATTSKAKLLPTLVTAKVDRMATTAFSSFAKLPALGSLGSK